MTHKSLGRGGLGVEDGVSECLRQLGRDGPDAPYAQVQRGLDSPLGDAPVARTADKQESTFSQQREHNHASNTAL